MPLGIHLHVGHSDPDSIVGLEPKGLIELEAGNDYLETENGSNLEIESGPSSFIGGGGAGMIVTSFISGGSALIGNVFTIINGGGV